MTQIKKTLVTQEHGYFDYDIEGEGIPVYRAKVPLNIKKGEVFSVYYGTSSKAGMTWEGSVEESINKHRWW